jgi:hypothetical protein
VAVAKLISCLQSALLSAALGCRGRADLQPTSNTLAVLQDGTVPPQEAPPKLQHLLPLIGCQLDRLKDVAVDFCRLLRTYNLIKSGCCKRYACKASLYG